MSCVSFQGDADRQRMAGRPSPERPVPPVHQCDIDILGEAGPLAEIELILATTAMLGKLDFRNFTVCINGPGDPAGHGGVQWF